MTLMALVDLVALVALIALVTLEISGESMGPTWMPSLLCIISKNLENREEKENHFKNLFNREEKEIFLLKS